MDLKDSIVKNINIEQYYSKHLTWKIQKGKNWSALCPFHDEKDASLFVQIDTGLFHCFGCDARGDIFTFHQKITGKDFNETIRELAKEAGINVEDYLPSKPTKGSTKKARKKNRPKLDDETKEKLHDEISDEVVNYLEGRGITKETIDKYFIGSWKEYIVFPVTKKGKIFNYRFKSTTEKRIWHLTAKDIKQKSPLWLFPEPRDEDEIYLCEGEIDALTLIQHGYNACTFTGGAGTWLDECSSYFKGKKVYIVYDVDEKGRVGARSVGINIAKVAEQVQIIRLDLNEEKYPNGDINDYFVKEKKTAKDFDELKKNAIPVVNVGEDLSVIEEDSCYYRIKQKKDDIELERISNFVIKLERRYRSNDNIVTRDVFMLRQDGKKIKCRIDPDDMSTARTFRKFCYSKGDFSFTGTDTDLCDIWQLVMAQDPNAKEVLSIFGVGYIEKEDMWLFGNMLIKNNNIILPDKEGICWNGNNGYIIDKLESKSENTKSLPMLVKPCDKSLEKIIELSNVLMENVGTFDAYYGIAFAAASVYFHDIVGHFGCFPLLWVYGKLQCGKNEFVKFLMRMFGIDSNISESLPSITSTVPINRRLSYYGSVPVWFDEYRNNLKNIEMVKGVFRSAYNASGRSLGLRTHQGILKEQFKSPVIVSGEELPEDDQALMSRLLVVHLNRKWRKDELYWKVVELSSEASSYICKLIVEKNKEKTKHLIETIEKYKKIILKSRKTISSRIILNHSIILGSYECLIGENEIFRDYVLNMDQLDPSATDEEEEEIGTVLSDFIEAVSIMIEKGDLNGISWYTIKDDFAYVWIKCLYDKYSEYYNRVHRKVPPGFRTIIDHLKSTEFCLDVKKLTRIPEPNEIYGKVRRCAVFSINKLNVQMKQWFEQLNDF